MDSCSIYIKILQNKEMKDLQNELGLGLGLVLGVGLGLGLVLGVGLGLV